MVPKPEDVEFYKWVGGINKGIETINKTLEDGRQTFLIHSENQNHQFEKGEKRFNDIERKLDRSLQECPYLNVIKDNKRTIDENARNISWIKGHLMYFYLAFLGLAGWIGYVCKKVFDYHSK